LIGGWFSGSKAETTATAPDKEQPAARATAADTKSKRAAPARTTAPAPVQSAQAAPAPTVRTPAPVQAAKAEPPPQSEIRTAYTTPPASNNGMLAGAQPVVPVGSFNSFR